MARNPNTFAKRQRELEKKRKAEDKTARRRKRKEDAKALKDPEAAEGPTVEAPPSDA